MLGKPYGTQVAVKSATLSPCTAFALMSSQILCHLRVRGGGLGTLTFPPDQSHSDFHPEKLDGLEFSQMPCHLWLSATSCAAVRGRIADLDVGTGCPSLKEVKAIAADAAHRVIRSAILRTTRERRNVSFILNPGLPIVCHTTCRAFPGVRDQQCDDRSWLLPKRE